MKYRFYGDILQLVKYELKFTENIFGQEQTRTETAIDDTERDKLLARYPEAEVSEVDNAGYEWLDGMRFTQEQQRAGEVEKAIETGEEGYMQYLMDSDPNYQMLELDMRLALLESGVSIDELYSVS